MRILMISDHADPLAEIGSKEAGGQNIYIFYLAKFLCHFGVSVDVYTRWDRENKREIMKINGHMRVIRVKAGPKKYMPRDNFINIIDEFTENILKRIKNEKIYYDIIHTNYWYSGIIGLKIAKIIKRPVVHVYHSIGQVRFNVLKKFKLQKNDYKLFQKRILCEKQIAKKADKIIATSPVEKKIIQKLFNIPSNKIEVITIGVNTKIFKPLKMDKARRFLGFDEKNKILLYVGRIEWRKGVGTLIYAFRKVISIFPNAKLYIIGGGKSKSAKKIEEAEQKRLKDIIKELKIDKKVYFLGPKKQKYLYRYYSASNACVVPSYYEPFGIVPLEAMACGTPVIASRTGGLKYSIKDNITGCLAEPRNYDDLAEKIEIVLKNGKKFYKNNCIKTVKNNFTWESIANKYKLFFAQLIN